VPSAPRTKFRSIRPSTKAEPGPVRPNYAKALANFAELGYRLRDRQTDQTLGAPRDILADAKAAMDATVSHDSNRKYYDAFSENYEAQRG
jgi:hypothetical protein